MVEMPIFDMVLDHALDGAFDVVLGHRLFVGSMPVSRPCAIMSSMRS
jgi:hypothetical protein